MSLSCVYSSQLHHGPSASLKIGHNEAAPWTAWLTNEEIELARELRDRVIARMEAGVQCRR